MKRYGTALTFLFLVYFVLYAVSPFFAALPQDLSIKLQRLAPEGMLSLQGTSTTLDKPSGVRGCGGHIDAFIFDLALWEILKRGKPSDDPVGSWLSAGATGSKYLHELGKCIVAGNAGAFSSSFHEVAYLSPTSHISSRITSLLSYSDLSPPLA